MDHATINNFMGALVAIVVIALGFFIKQWVISLDRSVNKLNITIQSLNDTVSRLESSQRVHEAKMEMHERDIRDLREQACPYDNCPIKNGVHV